MGIQSCKSLDVIPFPQAVSLCGLTWFLSSSHSHTVLTSTLPISCLVIWVELILRLFVRNVVTDQSLDINPFRKLCGYSTQPCRLYQAKGWLVSPTERDVDDHWSLYVNLSTSCEVTWTGLLLYLLAGNTVVDGVLMALSSLATTLGEGLTMYSPLALLSFLFFFLSFFFFFEVEISLRSPVPLFRRGSVHSGSASWYDCGGVSLTRCVWTRFLIGSHTMPAQCSQPTLTSLGQGCTCV